MGKREEGKGPMTAYAELQVTTNFSFLEGASHPEELALTAAALGHRAIAVTDRNSLAGVVRAHKAAKEAGIRLVVGARIDPEDGPSLLVFPTDRAAYGRLTRLITLGRRRAPKGECHLTRADVAAAGEGQVVLVLPPPTPSNGFAVDLAAYKEALPGPVFLAAQCLYRGADRQRLARLAALSRATGVPLVATNDVHYHSPDRRPLQDVLTCVRARCTIDEAGWRLAANAERHLKSGAEMARLFADHPEAVANIARVLKRCRFSLDELRYDYPEEVVTPGETPQQTLERLTWAGAAKRYGEAVPPDVVKRLHHELRLIGQLDYAPYFLTVEDIVRFARSQDILCQGRGSAANSAVCYVLGITAVDPARADLLFERFVSAARDEPPDIDVDFEHERREEVIQYIYEKYGRDRAGLTATVICYRGRGALRDVGKAMGLSADVVAKMAKSLWGWGSEGITDARVREAGLDPAEPRLRQALDLAHELMGFPRHLSQHVGGFVISRGPLEELVPIENAAMEDRTVIQWDKDDLDALGILKVDVLALGMLSCVHRGFDLIARHYGKSLDLASVPAEDPAVYDMLCEADSLGVFQVESRAQMTMLPRLRPRDFYDLVIEVAIVRPGPIQGDMVHPYLRRRNGEEPVSYPSDDLRRVLEKTLGVPLFQEQAMKIAIVGAGFTPDEADRLRRAMATFKKNGDIHKFRDKMVEGMVGRGYDRAFAERCFKQIEGFGTYGFPESHAASFALLVYVSAWIKRHHPDVFVAALLNSQPMGFYAPAQIVRDARDHGVEVRPPDINFSDWDCTLEPSGGGRHAVRLGLRLVKGLARDAASRLVEARQAGGLYGEPRAVWRRAGLGPPVLERLARADAFRSVGLDRRQAAWAVKVLGPEPLPLFAGLDREVEEPPARLPAMGQGQHVIADYSHLALTLKRHPMAFLRPSMEDLGYVPARRLGQLANGHKVAVAGLVLVRQRPGSAKGIIFLTLEDETGVANLVVMPPVFEAFRREVMTAKLLGVSGRVERQGAVIHVKAERLYDLSDRLALLDRSEAEERLSVLADGRHAGSETLVGAAAAGTADAFLGGLARADEVRRPGRDQRQGRDMRDGGERREGGRREGGRPPAPPAEATPQLALALGRRTRPANDRHPEDGLLDRHFPEARSFR